MTKTFVQVVREKFHYLVLDYGFEILSSVESPRDYFWEGEVFYATKTTGFYVECTRGEVPSFSIGRRKDINFPQNKNQYFMPLQTIYEYLVTTHQEKEIITSPFSARRANEIIYREKHISREVPVVKDRERKDEIELETYARVTRKYIEPFLLGDFSLWPAIWEYSVKKRIAQEIDLGRSEYVDIVIPDGKGKYRVIGKKHLYQEELDYIKELKRELSSRNGELLK